MIELINSNNVFDGLFSNCSLNKFGQVDESNSVSYDSVANMEITPSEQSIFNQIISALDPGQDAYVAGGWVRDKILGRQNKDIDIAVWDSRDTLNAANNIYEKLTGKPSESINAIGTTIVNIDGMDIEFTPFRKELYSEYSNKPEVAPGDIESETTRRDLTINSLLYDVRTGMILDYTQRGIKDIMNGVLDTPQDPEKTFREDPNRIMRAFRFSATLPNFEIHPRVLETIKRPEILELLKPSNRGVDETGTKMQKATPGEENFNQLYKMMTVDNTDNLLGSLNSMIETGALQVILGMDNAKWLPFDTPQRNQHHINDSIWNHIERVFQGLYENLPEDREDRFITRMSVLFHDLGKFRTSIRRPVPEEKLQKLREKKPDSEGVQWHGFWYTNHAEVSTQLANEALTDNIKAPNKIRDRIAKLVKMHDVLMEKQYADKIHKNSFDSSDAYQIIQDISRGGMYPQDVDNLFALMIADRRGHLDSEDLSDIENLRSKVEQLGEKIWMKPNEVVDGNFVKDIIDVKRVGGDKIGEVQRLVAYEYLNGKLKMDPEERAKQIAIERGWAIPELMPERSQINFQWIQENGLVPQEKSMIGSVIKRGKDLESQGLNNEQIIQKLKEEMK